MLLAIDIGNTQTVLGVYDADDRVKPQRMWRIATNKLDTADDIVSKIVPLLGLASISPSQISSVALASVVPFLTRSWKEAMGTLCGVEITLCTAEQAMRVHLFETNYHNPSEIGADRVADAVAARALFGSPVIVVDFGTATNIEVIDEHGCFAGGVIAPGIETGATALFAHATRLAEIDLQAPHAVIGTNTEMAVRAGIVLGEADRVDGLVRRIFDQLGCRGNVVATGGLASLVAEHSRSITHVLPELTLEGLRLIALSSPNA